MLLLWAVESPRLKHWRGIHFITSRICQSWNISSFPSGVAAVRKVSPNWSQETMTCHSFYCFSIVWGQGNSPLVTSLPGSGYICSGMVGGVMANVLVRIEVCGPLLRKPWDFTPTWWVINRVLSPPRGRGYSLIWPIRGSATGQGMVFVLSILNRVYNFAQVCPKQCAWFVRVCSNYKQGVSCRIEFVLVETAY